MNACLKTKLSEVKYVWFCSSDGVYLISKSKSKTPKRPTTATIVSMIVQDRKVSLRLRLKYSLKSQNPESFTWDNTKLPAPIERAIRFGSTEVVLNKGRTIPAAVRPATVAEPTATRITAAINQPNINGCVSILCKDAAISSLTPLSINTCFNAPAPAITNNTITTSFTASPYVLIRYVMLFPCTMPKEKVATAREIIMTLEASPKNAMALASVDAGWTRNSRPVVSISKITGSNAVKKLLRDPGSLSSGRSFGLNVFKG